MDKLKQFNRHYGALRKFVADGNQLLDSEKPVKDNATQVQQQMETCQVGVDMVVGNGMMVGGWCDGGGSGRVGVMMIVFMEVVWGYAVIILKEKKN